MTDDESAGAESEPDVPANGIRAVGAYAPRYRLSASELEAAWGSVQAAGVGEKAVPGADEDALTMAFEAATNALQADGTDAETVDVLAFASTTPPIEEEDVTVRLGSTLGVPSTARHEFFTGSTRVGARALETGLDASLDAGGVALVVAADCPVGELSDELDQAAGAGAVAFVVAPEAPAVVTDRATYANPYPGTRFRERGSERLDGIDVTAYERDAFRETLAGAVGQLDVDPRSEDGAADDAQDGGDQQGDDQHVFDAAAIQAPDGALPYRVAGALGVDADAVQRVATVHDLGDTGAASALLGLGRALDDPDLDRVLVASYGSGAGADAFVVESDGPVPASLALERRDQVDVSYAEYLRLRDEITAGPPEGGGAYVSVPTWRRTLPQRHRLVAGRCQNCGALAFPPEGACDDCRATDGYEHVELPGTGTVEAATTISQGGAPPEFSQQQERAGDFDVVIVAFDGPDGDLTASAPAQVSGADAGSVDVGNEVAATIRRIYTQEGVTRYGFKVRPLGSR